MDRVANSSTSEEQAQQQLESTTGECPFNIYNTEVVRADATQASEIENGDLLRTRRRQPSGMQSADENDDERATASEDQLEDHFALLKADYDLIEHMIPSDSVNNKSFTDVTFIVGPPQHSKKYVGHRVLLAMTSPVFETMFYGDMADKSKYIRIADVAPIGFENLLRYAYTDSLNLSSVEDAMLTAYAAKKYLLPQLLRECLTHIEHNIGPATACVVFEFAHVLNSQQLVLQAMNLIDRQTVNVITNKSFAHVQASTVEFVANRKYLNLGSEFALFDACLAWALAEARRRDLAQDDWPAIRGILGESAILGALRFLAMSQKEFARAVAKTSAGTLQAATSNSSTLAADGSSTGDGGGGELAPQGSQDSATGQDGGEMGRQRPAAKLIINPNDPNCLLNDREQRAIFLNLILGEGAAALPPSICQSTQTRQAPPECFTLKRFKSASNLAISTTTTRNIRSIVSKFQCLSENVFIVGLTIPIRLDASSYANRTPKFECHLKFTTRATAASTGGGSSSPLVNESAATTTTTGQQQQHQSSSSPSLGLQTSGQQSGPATLLMDTIDESLHISIARDKDCLVRLKRPILIRMGNINELTLTFQTYALDEDIVALRSPKLRSANFSEQTDGENISWLFFKTSGLEFSELHYYY